MKIINKFNLVSSIIAIGSLMAGCSSTNGIARTVPEGDYCESSDVCLEGLLCQNNVCRKLCTVDSNCATNQICADGVCTEAKGAECISAANCDKPPVCHSVKGASCEGGKCIYPLLEVGVACDDGDVCTTDTICDSQGLCGSGQKVICNGQKEDECLTDNNTLRIYDGAGNCISEDNQGCVYPYKDYPCQDCATNKKTGKCHQCDKDEDCTRGPTWIECFAAKCVDGTCLFDRGNGRKSCGGRCLNGKNYSFGECSANGEECSASFTSCNGYICTADNSDCSTECSANKDCMESHYCLGNACEPKFVDGTSCNMENSGNECLGGYCDKPASAANALCCQGPSCCQRDSDCQEGYACKRETSTCLPTAQVDKLENGASCENGEDCHSGFCVDHTCCSNASCPATRCLNDQTTTYSCANTNGICTPTTTLCGNFGCNGDQTACNTSCNNNNDCGNGFFCNSNSECEALHDQGKSCGTVKQGSGNSVGSTCKTDNCVDGVCCGSASCGTCQTCASGTCANVTSGQKDNDTCDDSSHVCDGNGNCDLIQGQICENNRSCLSENCVDDHCCDQECNIPDKCENMVTTSYSCSTGKCEKHTENCPNGCNSTGTACQGNCGKNSDCASNQFCNISGQCVSKIATGQTCGSLKNSSDGKGSSCTSGNCVDGVCCGSASCSTCQACNLSGSAGTCTAVKNGVDSDTCSGTKQCDASGNCDLLNGQSCTTATAGQCLSGFCVDNHCCAASSCPDVCTNDLLTPKSCNSGTCTAGTKAACEGNHSCKDSTSCYTGSCTDNSQCANGYYCKNGTCTEKRRQGDSCDGTNLCQSGLTCVDNHCCNSSSCGTCETCNTGSCVDLATGSFDDTCKNEDKKICGSNGVCLKQQGESCSSKTECYTNNCVGNTCCNVSSCNNTCSNGIVTKNSCASGTCQNTGTESCNGYGCNGNSCKTSCTANSDCLSGYFCNTSGKCVAKITTGSACQSTKNGEPKDSCSSGYCADGYCCENGCTTADTCSGTSQITYACNVSDHLGTCFQQTASCGSNRCNGTASYTTVGCSGGVCTTNTTNCAAKSCTGNTLITPTCSASSGCSTSSSTCPNHLKCNSSSTDCLSTCSKNADCLDDYYCNSNGVCTLKLTNGSGCNPRLLQSSADPSNSICSSGFCSWDYFCTSTECSPQNVCVDNSGSLSQIVSRSGQGGTCTGTGLVKRCNGYKCASQTACKTSCLASSDCTSGYICSGGKCLKDLGQSCSLNTDCASNICALGYCCSTACTNSCSGNMISEASCSTGTCTHAAAKACKEDFSCQDSTSCATSCPTEGSTTNCSNHTKCHAGKCFYLDRIGQSCRTNSNECTPYGATYPDVHCTDTGRCQIPPALNKTPNNYGCNGTVINCISTSSTTCTDNYCLYVNH